ncbi:MAG: AraC family transcriptional regulator [Cyclobacteriaceae bacterium]|nr:AraC family transcriptional regulator [Cyclobacteriaceae bacterium]MBX2915334.1 AraC family transcriptional regulator [Cyclobacteriaceae bacterium]
MKKETSLHFPSIENYIQKLNLDVRLTSKDFIIYDYRKVNHNTYAQLASYRQSYFEISLDLFYGCNIIVDSFHLPHVENRLLFISPYRIQSLKGDTEKANKLHSGYSILFTPDFLQVEYSNPLFLHDYPFFNPYNTPVIGLNQMEASSFEELAKKMLAEYLSHEKISAEIIRHYLHILLLRAKQKYLPLSAQPAISREMTILYEYQHLIKIHSGSLQQIHQYASIMHISPKHLSESVKRASGSSALQLLHKEIIHQAQNLLIHTSKTIAEIAYELNFENPHYFSTFFKRLTGKNPSDYRIIRSSSRNF